MQEKDIIKFQFAISIDKLSFFAPDNHKYAFLVIPFGPTYAPGF